MWIFIIIINGEIGVRKNILEHTVGVCGWSEASPQIINKTITN